MEGIAWCAEAMKASQKRLEVAADNLSNAESDAFHAHVVSFTMRSNGLQAAMSTTNAPGPLKHTDRLLDIAVVGQGGLAVAPFHAGGPQAGAVTFTRGGSFNRNAEGYVVDAQGRGLIGRHGFVRIDEGADITPEGAIVVNNKVADRLATANGTRVASGFVEAPDVSSITEMVSVLDAQRSFETAQKSLSALDGARQKAIDDVGSVK